MDFSQYQINQLTDLLNSGAGIAAVCGFLILLLASFVLPSLRWFCLIFLLYICTLGAFMWTGDHFFSPVQELRAYGRPLCIGLLIILCATAIRSRLGWRPRVVIPATIAFLCLEFVTSARLMLDGDFVKGFLGILIFAMIFLALGFGLGRWLQTLQDVEKALKCIIFAGVLVCLGTLIQWVIDPSQVIWASRLAGTTGSANFLGALLAVCILPLFYFFSRAGIRTWMRVLVVVLAAVFAALLVWSGSRTGLLMLIVGTAIFFRKRMGRLAILCVGLAIVGMALWQILSPGEDVAGRIISTENTRSGVWGLLLSDFFSSPIWGMTGVYASENSYLDVAARCGIIGLIPLCWFMALSVKSMLRLHRSLPALGELAPLADLTIAAIVSLLAGAFFEGYLVGLLTIPVFALYIYLAIVGFLQDSISLEPVFRAGDQRVSDDVPSYESAEAFAAGY